MSNLLLITCDEGVLQQELVNPLHGMGPLMSLCVNIQFSLSMCEKPTTKIGTQVGAWMLEDDNGDDDVIMVKNECKTLLLIKNYWVDLENGK